VGESDVVPVSTSGGVCVAPSRFRIEALPIGRSPSIAVVGFELGVSDSEGVVD
jgi:hypothetical protein